MGNEDYFIDHKEILEAEKSTILRQAQLLMLEMVKVVDAICSRHGLIYTINLFI